MRARAAAVAALALLAAGCGSGGRPPGSTHAAAGTLEALWQGPGQAVTLVAGTSDYSPGTVRLSFLVVDHSGRPSSQPRALVWVARGLRQKPFQRAAARLEQVAPASDTVTRIYVTRFSVGRPGTYWVVAKPVGGPPIQALGTVVVHSRSVSPMIGQRAYPSRTPTLASAHGNLAKLTTRVPPDRALVRYSIAGSLSAHAPFVVVFATPKFCTSRTCGPVVDVVDAVRRRFARTAVRFIHVEIYRGNDPTRGENEWVRQWHLPTEPWVFLVGRDGRIRAKFEGTLSPAELAAAVRRYLPA